MIDLHTHSSRSDGTDAPADAPDAPRAASESKDDTKDAPAAAQDDAMHVDAPSTSAETSWWSASERSWLVATNFRAAWPFSSSTTVTSCTESSRFSVNAVAPSTARSRATTASAPPRR